jgi:drug/metabolite transporter (DMT)-like permease
MLLTTAIGLAGVLLVAKPSEALLDSQALVGLAASILAAFAFVSIREMSDTEPAFRIVFYFSLFSALISAVPLTWAWQPLDQHQLGLLLVIGLLATVSQIVMSKAYGLAPPGLIGPFAYLAIVFAGIVAWLRWGEMPDLTSLIGAALIFSASLLSIARRPAVR